MLNTFRSLVIVGATALCLVACGPSGTIAEQIEANIAAMEAAGEAGERGDFMSHVADGFEAQEGRMTRDEFQGFLFLQFNRQRRIRTQLFPIAVAEQGPNLAEANFNVLVTGGAGLIPDDGQLFSVRTAWVLEGGDWLLWRADWSPITP
jgi:hypothetical protein